MSWSGFDRVTLAAIALGGVAGASLRWLATHEFGESVPADWFAYSPNTSIVIGPSTTGVLEPVRSSRTIASAAGIPYDSLFVNLLGCLLLGALTCLLVGSTIRFRRLLIGAATGLCGSLTTFSTFAVEVAVLLRGKPILAPEVEALDVLSITIAPSVSTALAYIALSIIGGGLAFWLGRLAAKRIVTSPGDVTIGELA